MENSTRHKVSILSGWAGLTQAQIRAAVDAVERFVEGKGPPRV
jgi:hypothetical protein